MPIIRTDKLDDFLKYIDEIDNDNEILLINDLNFINSYNSHFMKNKKHEYTIHLEEFFTDDEWNMINFEKRDVIIPRQELIAGASPEGFKFSKIFPIYDNSSDEELEQMTSGGALALEYGIKMKTIECDVINLKITYPKDLKIFKKTIHSYFFE